jgi:hypothetical protein
MTTEVREEQANFLKNNLDSRPRNFFMEFKYRRRASWLSRLYLRLDKALQDDPNSEKLLDLKRQYNNNNYKNDRERYEDWKKNKKVNVCCFYLS